MALLFRSLDLDPVHVWDFEQKCVQGKHSTAGRLSLQKEQVDVH